MSSKSAFFNLEILQTALGKLLAQCPHITAHETIATADATGRILASAPQSPMNLPNFIRSTMDGYAVIARDTFAASDTLPAYLNCVGEIVMGTQPDITLQSGETVEIHTGAMLPDGANAVVMVEQTQALENGEIEILKPVAPGENLVQIGEDVRQGAEVLPIGRRLRPQDIGGLLAVGITQIEVVARPRVGILSCGDELIPPSETPEIGQIRDINAYILGTMFTQHGAETQHHGIARDTFDDFFAKAQSALAQSDMLIMSAGSSVSVRDLTQQVINQLGAPGIIQHGLAVKPGKPTILAICDGKPVIGLPGNPVSAMSVARQVVLPILQHLSAETTRPQGTIQAQLTHNVASVTGREDSIPVRLLQQADGIYHAEPIFGKSNLIYTLVNADGLLTVPLNSGGFTANSIVEILPF